MRRRPVLLALGLLVSPFVLLGAQAQQARNRTYLTVDDAPAVGGRYAPDITSGGPELHLLVAGDSTATGVGASRSETTVAVRLAAGLAEQTGRAVVLASVAVPGARVADLAAQLERARTQQVLQREADVVVLLIGANDATHLTPLGDVQRDMAAAVRSVREAGAAVIVGTCPDMGARNFARPLRDVVAWRGRQVATVQNAAVTEAGGVPVPLGVLVGPAFQKDPATLSSDGFHPSDVGYALWAEALLPPLVTLARRHPAAEPAVQAPSAN